MPRVIIRIMSNLPDLGSVESSRVIVAHELMDQVPSLISIIREFYRARNFQVVLLNACPKRLFIYCFFRYIYPNCKWILVSLDQNLLIPNSPKDRIIALIKRFLLKKVDLFILYLRDVSGYERYYGVTARRTAYIPFKVNVWDMVGDPREVSSDGDYVLVAGRSLRDLKTFIKAMSRLKFPAVLLHQGEKIMGEHNTIIQFDQLPMNVTAAYHDGKRESWYDFIRKARIVVIPTLPTITAAGVSVYLDAMALKKCVILNDNPASRGILTGQAIIVPPQDPQRLAEAIRMAWTDDDRREQIATKGWEYAQTLQGEKRLMKDIIECCASFHDKEIGNLEIETGHRGE